VSPAPPPASRTWRAGDKRQRSRTGAP